jgi:mRNA interferase RelE/StbE
MWKILWEKKALRQLKKILPQDQTTIVEAVRGLAVWPNCRNVKALTDHLYPYRLRVGRYRIFFDIDENLHIVKIEEVKKRHEGTY